MGVFLSRIGRKDIKYFAKKVIRNILHANIDVHIRILIAEFPAYGLKYIFDNCDHIVQTWIFLQK